MLSVILVSASGLGVYVLLIHPIMKPDKKPDWQEESLTEDGDWTVGIGIRQRL